MTTEQIERLFLTVEAAAAERREFETLEAAFLRTGVSTRGLRRLIKSGAITAYRPLKRRLLLDRNELDQYLLSTRQANA